MSPTVKEILKRQREFYFSHVFVTVATRKVDLYDDAESPTPVESWTLNADELDEFIKGNFYDELDWEGAAPPQSS